MQIGGVFVYVIFKIYNLKSSPPELLKTENYEKRKKIFQHSNNNNNLYFNMTIIQFTFTLLYIIFQTNKSKSYENTRLINKNKGAQ